MGEYPFDSKTNCLIVRNKRVDMRFGRNSLYDIYKPLIFNELQCRVYILLPLYARITVDTVKIIHITLRPTVMILRTVALLRGSL